MSTVLVPGSAADALGMLEAALGFLADADPAEMPAALLAEVVAGLERADSVEAVARARLLAAFDAQDVSVTFGQRTTRTFLVHCLRVTKGQAAQHQALQALGRRDSPLLAGLRDKSLTRSEALQLAQWTRVIPAEFRSQAEEILAAAARAGADLRALAAICAEIQARTCPPDPDNPGDPDRGLSLETTMDGAGVLRGALTPGCAAMVTAVLDALSAPDGGGDLRTRPERYHDALAEAMRRLLASGLLPKRAGQPARALAHIHFTELLARDKDSVLQAAWITDYRARWAARRAAASVGPGDGGAWLTGDAARAFAHDAMIIPVVTGDLDPLALEDLISLCVQYHHARAHAASPGQPEPSGQPGPSGQAGQGACPAQPGRPGPPGPTRPGGRRTPRRWPGWRSRSWPGSSRSSPAPAGSPPSCAATSSARASAAPRCRWTSARPTISPSTSAAWPPCGTRAAPTPAAATSPPPPANPTTSGTAPTADPPA